MVCKTVHYQVKPEGLETVEAAMHDYAAYLSKNFSDCLWWTASESKDSTRFVTLITAPNEARDEALRACEGTKTFVDILYAHTIGEVRFTDVTLTATSTPIP